MEDPIPTFARRAEEMIKKLYEKRARRENGAFGERHPAIRGPHLVIEGERLWVGVDLVVLHTFLSQVPDALWDAVSWRQRERKGLLGFQGSYRRDGFLFQLRRFPRAHGSRRKTQEAQPSPRPSPARAGYDLSIRFNPGSITQATNADVESPLHLLETLLRLRALCQELELPFDPTRLPMCEVHLARDLWIRSVSQHLQAGLEQEVSDLLRVFEWGQPRRMRQVRDYMGPYAAEELSRDGLVRGTKRWNWTIYDKTREQQQKGIRPKANPSMERSLRIEWRLKSRPTIEKALGLTTCHQLLLSLARQDLDLQSVLWEGKPLWSDEDDGDNESYVPWLFDQAVKDTFFADVEPYGQRLPTLDLPFVEAMASHFSNEREQQCLQRLRLGTRISAQDVDVFIGVLDKVGAAEVRRVLRHVFALDTRRQCSAVEAKARTGAYERCQEKLTRLRAMAYFDLGRTWTQKRAYVKARMQVW